MSRARAKLQSSLILEACKPSLAGAVTTGSGKEYPKLGAEDLPPYVATRYIPPPLVHGVPDVPDI